MVGRGALFLYVSLMVLGCGSDAPTAKVDSAAVAETRRVVLVEPDSAPISSIRAVAIAPDGSILVLDGVDCRIRRFDAESGALRGTAGRCGGGPGEFIMPLAVVTDDSGNVYVSDATPRITRFRADLVLDTTYSAEPFLGVRQLLFLEGLLIGVGMGVTTLPGQPLPDELIAINPATGNAWTFYAASPSRHLPYWNGTWFTSIASLPGRQVLVAGSMEYPLAVVEIDSGVIGQFGAPPKSYRAPSLPEIGAFAPPQHVEKSMEWYASFTDISGVWTFRNASSSWVAVTHYEKVLGDNKTNVSIAQYRADLYENGIKRAADIPLPGRVVGVSGEHLLVLSAEPPEGWTLSYMGIAAKRPKEQRITVR